MVFMECSILWPVYCINWKIISGVSSGLLCLHLQGQVVQVLGLYNSHYFCSIIVDTTGQTKNRWNTVFYSVVNILSKIVHTAKKTQQLLLLLVRSTSASANFTNFLDHVRTMTATCVQRALSTCPKARPLPARKFHTNIPHTHFSRSKLWPMSIATDADSVVARRHGWIKPGWHGN